MQFSSFSSVHNSHGKAAVAIIVTFLLTSWVVSALVSLSFNYTHKISEPLESFGYLYEKPWTRLGPYVMGKCCKIAFLLHRLASFVLLKHWKFFHPSAYVCSMIQYELTHYDLSVHLNSLVKPTHRIAWIFLFLLIYQQFASSWRRYDCRLYTESLQIRSGCHHPVHQHCFVVDVIGCDDAARVRRLEWYVGSYVDRHLRQLGSLR